MSVDKPEIDRCEVCVRCGHWFEPYEGKVVAPQSGGMVARVGRVFARVDGKGVFICEGCMPGYRREKIWVNFFFALVVMVMAVFFLLFCYHSIQGIIAASK